MGNTQTDPNFYELRDAVSSDRATAARLVASNPGIVHARNSIGETALHFLAVENDLEGVTWLIRQGADINTRNNFEATPLMEAASLNYVALCRFLLAQGADVFAKDKNDGTVFSAASMSDAADACETTLLELMLEHLGDVDLNDVIEELNAHFIVARGHPAVIQLLRSRGLKNWDDDPEQAPA